MSPSWDMCGATTVPSRRQLSRPEVNAWKSFYGVTSIFFDGAAVSKGEESYYQTISATSTRLAGSWWSSTLALCPPNGAWTLAM